MRGTPVWWVIGALGVIALGVAVLAIDKSYVAEPSILMLTPEGGDAWALGSTHTITWSAKNVPQTDKVAITIRRIPPPPLQEEGQEFDPVIFTDLPNTGHAEWTIAPMYPVGTYVLGIHAYASLPSMDDILAESATFELVPAPLTSDLYPLYDKVSWGALQKEIFAIATTSYAGTSVASVPVTNTMDPASIFSPFEKYYAGKLSSLGWKVDNYMAAGGHVGGQTGYRKGDELVLVRFNIKYHTVPKDAPSECPCDVTVSLFGAKTGPGADGAW